MEKIKKAYYYFFYKIYKSIEYTSELVGGAFWTDFKAGLVIGALEIWFLISIGIYLVLITNKNIAELTLTQPIVFIPLIIILLLNYFSFIHTDKWKEYNNEFDQLSIKKNKIGGKIVWCTVVFIIINLFFSYYLLLMRAKRNHTGPYSKEYIHQQKVKDSISGAKYK
ncbi:hypothetical protein [Chryseobacterium nepalense]|uniref:hypothetical protein n=1 Tax=Chryseobacterium nepalense TaxID=1854498 RepID=UPI002DF88185|nr:heme/copper-type cytochrome/quinol oxidase subunit 2 [Chryseobacterium nepalense]